MYFVLPALAGTTLATDGVGTTHIITPDVCQLESGFRGEAIGLGNKWLFLQIALVGKNGILNLFLAGFFISAFFSSSCMQYNMFKIRRPTNFI